MPKVLVIDDEQEVLRTLKRQLEHLGFDTETTDSWETGLDRFTHQQYDLVVLDVHMPGIDGFRLARRMKKEKPNQKILIMTGLSAGEAFKYLEDADVDVDEILYKPFSFQKIREILQNIFTEE
jgi:CheY-like chemotaxis protein